MTGIILGVLCIIGGVVWGVMAAAAAGMASRSTTWWEHTGTPLLGLIPCLIGILFIVFR